MQSLSVWIRYIRDLAERECIAVSDEAENKESRVYLKNIGAKLKPGNVISEAAKNLQFWACLVWA